MTELSPLGQAIAEIEDHMVRNRVDERRRYRQLDRRLEGFAHDRRNGDPFDLAFLEWKRTYQWAVSAWMCGFLDAGEFHRRVREFDAAIVAAADRMSRRHDAAPIHVLTTEEQCQREEKRLRRMGRTAYVDRRAWVRLVQARNEIKERDRKWHELRTERAEKARQRRLLREGQQTLTAIRKYLRAPGQSLPLESRPARTSPTS